MLNQRHPLTVSIVTYQTDPEVLETALLSVQNSTLPAQVYIVDNSPQARLGELARTYGAVYLQPGANLGFGRGHNYALRQIADTSAYHLILNADVWFDSHVLEELHAFMEINPHVGWVMPNVLYPDGSRQELCKRLPTPWDLFHRRFLGPVGNLFQQSQQRFRCRDLDLSRPCMVPNLSGCFAFIRTQLLQQVGGFDERYFLYLEDTDLVRKIGEVASTVFYPHVDVYHVCGRGSYRDLRLLARHMRSSVQYFSKWGWFSDSFRAQKNREAAHQNVEIRLPQAALAQ